MNRYDDDRDDTVVDDPVDDDWVVDRLMNESICWWYCYCWSWWWCCCWSIDDDVVVNEWVVNEWVVDEWVDM